MKTPSFRWQSLILSLLIFGTVGVVIWSALAHFGVSDGFMPHAHCYLLKRDLILIHGISDFVIGVSYVLISATLTYLVLRARREIPFHWMMLAFAAFIVACGATHFMEVWTLQAAHPPYYLAGDIKLVTALASAATALLLPPLVPKILRLLEEARLSAQRKNAEENARAALERARESENARDAAEAANRAKDQFLAVLSHELRTPLTPALITAQRLESQPDVSPEELRRAVGVIRRNIELEAQLIDDLLDVTRIARGKLQLNLAPVDLHESIHNAVEMCHSEIEKKSNTMRLDLLAERQYVEGDAPRLLQVIWNLLLNAVKFTPADGTITIRSSNSEDGKRLLIDVSDTGIGIAPEILPRIFEPFEQGEQSRRGGFGGLGLGLAVVKGLVNAHHGTIAVTSEGVGKGATFHIEFETTEPPVLSAGAGESSSTEPELPLHVLLVEDHEETRAAMERLLARWGHRVDSSGTVQGALRLAEENEFDVLVSDLGLPDGKGTELMAELRRRHPTLVGVGVSGYGMEEDIRRSLEAGFAVHLTKPIAVPQLKEFLSKLAQSLGRRDRPPE